VKAGFQKNRMQKIYCKECKKYQQAAYCSEAYHPESNKRIATLVSEGVGLRSISRILGVSLKTVIERIKLIANDINKPFHQVKNGVYEIDELWTYVGSKSNETWVMYIFDRNTKIVLDFKVGARSKVNLRSLTDQTLIWDPASICTDGLRTYKSIIPKSIHRVGLVNTRRIERRNLNIRMHLKRLSRKTICFSKSVEMLKACLRIYFWRGNNIKIALN
jgi:insertion element IS1 protein InsB